MPGTLTLHDGDRGAEWDELIGRTVGSYRVVRLLGRGGMGSVFLARHPGIGSQVAVKFLHPRFSHDRHTVERFFNEARAVNVIGHENILKILDFNVTPDGRHYFVMEYLAGRTLQALVAGGKPVPLAVAGPILLQCCRALRAAHERHIVHRDLKPDNVFLVRQMGKQNFVKLVDFGIAKLVDPANAQGLTEAGTVIGTPEYMSPEQAAGRGGEIGRRSDVYSLGVVMYQLATGRVPFSHGSVAETLVAHMERAPAPPRSIEPSVPEAWEAIILKALAKKREDRFQTMAELHDALAACLAANGLSTELPEADAETEADTTPAVLTPEPPAGGAPTVPGRFPVTAQVGGAQSLSARIGRGLDWALAPHRRALTLGSAAAAVLLLALATRPGGEPAAKPPAKAPVKAAPVAVVPPAPEPASPAPPVTPPPAAPAKPARRPVAQRPAPSRPPAPAPAKPAPPAAVAVAVPPAPAGPPTAAEAARAARESSTEAADAARAAAELRDAAAKAAQAEAELSPPPSSAKLYVGSDPLGATVTAAWSGKSATGRTPFVFRVRRGAAVTVTFSKAGYAPAVQEINAQATQAVVVALTRQP